MITKEELNTLDTEDARYREDFHNAAREHLRDYVEHITEAAPRFGKNAYVCPCCKSGTGNNGKYTPAFYLFRTRRGELHFKCHACDITGDIFALAGYVNHLVDFPEKERFVASFLGIDLAHRTPLSQARVQDAAVSQPRTQRETLQLKKAASAYIIKCQKAVGRTDYFHKRGLTDETIRQFKLGYDPDKQLAVIPFSSTYYACRNTRIGVDERGVRKHSKPAGLSQPLFNLVALSHTTREPVFLTEAPFDAMSIIQCGGRALALGGSSTTLLKKMLDIYRPTNVFVLAFDSDGAGEALQDKVGLLLEERGLPYSLPVHSAFFAFKDANAALMGNPEALAEGVEFERKRALEALERMQEREGREKPEAMAAVAHKAPVSASRSVTANPSRSKPEAER